MTLFDELAKEGSEGARNEIYLDHLGIPTIGVGYNLRSANVLKAVLKNLGILDNRLQMLITIV